MSDSSRVHRIFKQAIMQLFPGQPKGNAERMPSTLAALVSSIILGKSCQQPAIARKAPDGVVADDIRALPQFS